MRLSPFASPAFIAALSTTLALAACQRQAAPAAAPPAPAPAPTAAPSAEPPQNVAGIMREGVAVEPGERKTPLITDGPAVVHPESTFRVVLTKRSPDARLSLLDGSDAVVAAEGGRELAEGTTLTLKPSARLAPAGAYVLRLDGAASREVHDEDGASYQPMSVNVQVSGEPAPPPEKPARKKKP